MGCERKFDERRRISVPLSDEHQWSLRIPQQWRDHRYQRLSFPATTTLAAATLTLATFTLSSATLCSFAASVATPSIASASVPPLALPHAALAPTRPSERDSDA